MAILKDESGKLIQYINGCVYGEGKICSGEGFTARKIKDSH